MRRRPAALLDALEGDIESVVDLTLVYPNSASFWTFLSGAGEAIGFDAEEIKLREIPRSREARARWLPERWSIKDRRIDAIRARAGR